MCIRITGEWWAILVAVLLICNGMLNSYVGCVPNVGKTDEGKKYDCDKDTDSESIDADNVNVELGFHENHKQNGSESSRQHLCRNPVQSTNYEKMD